MTKTIIQTILPGHVYVEAEKPFLGVTNFLGIIFFSAH